jgi:signal transduction histidine kinase/CheY-like chemotaxis protein
MAVTEISSMKLQILHLEDNADDVELVRRSLGRQGVACDIHAVTSGPDYVSALERKQFDVILSDSGLPGYDGRAALAAAHERCPSVPFIVLSGSVPPSPLEKVSPPGVAAHLAKSDMKQLGAVIQHALQKVEPKVESVRSDAYVLGMKHLVSVAQRLSLARNLETVIAIVRRAARDLTGADGATFVLREGDLCHYAGEDAIGPLWKGRRFPLTACISGWAMLNRQAAVIENIYEDPRIPHDAYRSTFVKSLVMMPIRSLAPIGAIGAYWADNHRATPEEVELLQALADSASIAIEAVDVFKNLERRVAERTEELHRSAGQLEVANRELEAFSYSVAHDLRSPLIAIDGFCNILLESCAQTFDEESREYLARISTSVSRMHRLIEDLLSLSKMSLATVNRAPVDLSSIAREIMWSLRERSPERSMEFVIGDGLVCEGDPDLLRVVLENLLANAWKYTSKRKSAHIEFGVADLPSGERAYFVQDNGAGFDSRFAEKLFRPFCRLHTQAEFPGTGIGLALSQRVIQRHDGKIWAESQLGCGATFYFTIPALLK